MAAAETLQASGYSSSDGSSDYEAADRGSSERGSSGQGSSDHGSSDHGAYVLTIAALRLHAERMQLSAAERRVSRHFTTAHPHVPVAEVPDQPDDVHDLAGLRAVGDSFRNQ
jgi:hypothetical protein